MGSTRVAPARIVGSSSAAARPLATFGLFAFNLVEQFTRNPWQEPLEVGLGPQECDGTGSECTAGRGRDPR